MALQVEERRRNFDVPINENSVVASTFRNQNGTEYAIQDTSPVPHQAGITGAEARHGGSLRLVMCKVFPSRSTLQGYKINLRFLTDAVYDIHSPPPIFMSGLFWIKLSRLPAIYKTMVENLDRADTAPFVNSGTPWSAACFTALFNELYCTDQDYLISSETSKETQAALMPIQETMEILGDDAMDLNYDELHFLMTGYYPKDVHIETLGRQARRGKMFAPSMLVPSGSGQDPVVGTKFADTHTYSMTHNHIAIETSFLCLVAGVSEIPNNDSLYGTSLIANPDASNQNTRGKRRFNNTTGSPSNSVLDRGAPFGCDLFRNATNLNLNPEENADSGELNITMDSTGAAANMQSTVHLINYLTMGEVRFDRDLDPVRIESSTVAGSNTAVTSDEDSEGSEDYRTHLSVDGGYNVLLDFPEEL